MSKKKVMIVDDEVGFLKIVKLNLEETGKYEVLALSIAKDVVSQAAIFNPDIILLDLLMPAMGGIEVCEMLNDNPVCRGIPVIVLSALDKSVDKVKAYKVGVVDYLVKPIEIDKLITKIEKALKFK